MSTPPRLRGFAAWINLMPGQPSKLIVTGEVETPDSAHLPRLERNDGPLTTGTTLALDLTIHASGGIGSPAFDFRDARYEAPATQGQYQTVLLLWEGKPINRLNVTEAH